MKKLQRGFQNLRIVLGIVAVGCLCSVVSIANLRAGDTVTAARKLSNDAVHFTTFRRVFP